ncbi:hypothetical protein MRS45_22190 [Pseudomonas viridiflava]|uniref:Lipoprotein n=1 Tax=Pseudomonas viridiflava TaxID=33069 RepID=A0ABU7NBJ0_PSEVI|nr:hypothetical protein [Pseudomonas viridiflava]MCJ8178811.1 hypothetical protein [Pseudomonas viridiflava]MEE3937476.1 hypothetical protein [Pseudomonas viridiflava]MEE4042300.1 hypothetical protein [Pseudomonas viridiflava]MEE4061792.1 hypothetical protein [Pseudomonas viridiflava]MEE4171269.1 hypothetical protein [Pseudomonas viridiflava]
MKKSFYAVLLTGSLLVMAGCDQIESSSKQMLNTAADSAKKAIDETHQAASKAVEEAKRELSVLEPTPSPAEPESKSGKEI